VDVLKTRNHGGRARGGRRVRIAMLFAVVATAVTVTAALNAFAQTPEPADTVFLNAKALRYSDQTAPYGDTGHSYFSDAVAVTDGKISYVGDDQGARALIGDDTAVKDLDGRMMMPGIIDEHWHGDGYSACNMGYQGGTVDAILGKLKACLTRADQLPYLNTNLLLSATLFNGEDVLPPGTAFTRHILDRLSADPAVDPFGTGTTRPIRVSHMDHHKFYTNTKAIQNAGFDETTPDPVSGYIGRDPDNYPNGSFEGVSGAFGSSPPPPANSASIAARANMALASRNGLTTIMQMFGGSAAAARYKTLADEGNLTVNVENALNGGPLRGATDPVAIQAYLDASQATVDANDGYSSPNSPGVLTMHGIIGELFCDGVAEYPTQTAAMHDPYNVNTGTPENPVWTPGTNRGDDPSCADSRLGFVEAHKAGFSIMTHSIGDRAVTDSLDNFEAAQREMRWDSRDSITHDQFVRPADIPRYSQIGVMANLQLQWASRDPYVANVEGYVSPSNYNTQYPAGDLARAGATLTSGSDFPIDPLLPFEQIETAVDRLNDDPANLARWPGQLAPQEALTLDQSMMMHTIGSAYGLFMENQTGSIDVGKDADLLVLDRNLYDIPVGDISDTKVLLTMTRGKIVHEEPEAASFDAEGAKVLAEAPQFPVQPAGTIGPLRKVTVTAGGDRTLKVGDVGIEGAPGSEGDFLLTSQNCSDRSFAPGESCTVGLRFAPAEGDKTSTGAIVLGANISGGEHRVPLTAQSSTPATDTPAGKRGKCAKKKSAKAKKKCKKRKRR
jgi:predicted amidohydrolase YtcJ